MAPSRAAAGEHCFKSARQRVEGRFFGADVIGDLAPFRPQLAVGRDKGEQAEGRIAFAARRGVMSCVRLPSEQGRPRPAGSRRHAGGRIAVPGHHLADGEEPRRRRRRRRRHQRRDDCGRRNGALRAARSCGAGPWHGECDDERSWSRAGRLAGRKDIGVGGDSRRNPELRRRGFRSSVGIDHRGGRDEAEKQPG